MITSQDKEIQNMVNDIRDGRLLLPEMQRGYVWKGPQVRNLFDSLYRGYPSGQLLVWETNELPFTKTISIDAASSDGRRPQLLLDGQQRMTSLAAVMLGRELRVRDSKKPIDIAFNVYTEKFEVAGPRQRGESGWLSLTKLFTEGPFSIMRDLKLDLNSPEANQIYERLKRLDNIKTYKYRVNVLENLSYEEVTDIFVRINSGGTTLAHADLALAQISSRWHGVTDVLDQYRGPIWRRYSLWLDTGMLLRTISLLLTGQSRLSQFFRGDQSKITVSELQNAWQRARHGLDLAIEFLTHNCRIDRLSLLPTNYFLVTLAVFFDRFKDDMSVRQSRDLQRWVYLALIWSRYSGASETALDQDYATLTKDDPIAQMIQNLEDKVGKRQVTERELREQRKNSPYMVMSYVLARYAEAEDWFNGVKIGGNQPLELHHIFPKAVLRETYNLRADSRTVDQIANLAFLSRRANARINSRQPSEYLIAIEEQRLRAQHVPLDKQLWTAEHFEDFVHERRQLIASAINKLINSLTDNPTFWPASETYSLESRVNALELQLRELITIRLTESRGDSAIEHCIPKEIRKSIEGRKAKRLEKNPFQADELDTLGAVLQFCQFSDYPKIMHANWPLFQEEFGGGPSFDQHVTAITTIRNAFAHNNPLAPSDLLLGEAGLLWMEECLDHIRLDSFDVDSEDEESDEMGMPSFEVES